MQSSISQPIALASSGLTDAGLNAQVNCDNFNTVAIQVVGTITSTKYLTVLGRLDAQDPGVTIAKFTDRSTGLALASGHIIAAGIYLVNCAALKLLSLVPSSGFGSTNLQITFSASQAVMDPTP